MIPRIFHRVWLDEPVPKELDDFWLDFQKLHPDWTFKTWTESQAIVDMLSVKDIWDMVDKKAGRADLARYHILKEYGGFYVDADVQPLKSFDGLLDTDRFIIGWESEDRLCPTVMGCTPGHAAAILLVEEISEWVALHADVKDPVIQTGPIFVTDILRDREDVRRVPPYYFYPIGPTEWPLVGRLEPHPDSYALHHWKASWKGGRR